MAADGVLQHGQQDQGLRILPIECQGSFIALYGILATTYTIVNTTNTGSDITMILEAKRMKKTRGQTIGGPPSRLTFPTGTD